MKLIKCLLVACLLSLQGCAGIFVAGAATTAAVVTDPRSTQEQWQDKQLELEVTGIGNKAPFPGKARVSAIAYQGKILLIGQAVDENTKSQLEQQIRSLNNVKVLHNQIRVRELLTLSNISNDSWITTKVKSALLTNKELNGIKVKVNTEDSEVFLSGYIAREHADIATDVARNISGVKQVIRAFEYAE